MTKKQKILLIVIVTLSFLYRLLWLDYPLINTEPQRDYLIAQHILTFKDLPKSGPCCLFNGSYAPYRHPVIYYYILSWILAINQNFMFLTFINLLLQLIPIITIFVLASRFFSYKTGLLAIIFFSFNQEIFKNALFVWQPHLKQPFLYGSFWALFLFYQNRKYWLLAVSAILFFMACAIHLSAAAIAPFWFLALIFILYSQKRSVKFYLMTFLLVSISLLALLKGVSFEVFKNHLLLIHTSILNYGQSLITNVGTYVHSIYGDGKNISIVGLFLLVLNFIFLILYLRQKELGPRKLYIIILISIIVGFIAVISLFKATIWHYYLEPLFGVTMILLAKTITSQTHRPFKILAILFVILFIGQFLMYYPPQIRFFGNARNIDKAATILARAIKNVQREKKYPQPNFFRIQVYTQGVETPTASDLAFWLPLEQKLQQKFIAVDDTTKSFKRLNSSDYIYIVCQSFGKTIQIPKECLSPFNKEFSGYKINKVIYEKEPFTIYEAQLK